MKRLLTRAGQVAGMRNEFAAFEQERRTTGQIDFLLLRQGDDSAPDLLLAHWEPRLDAFAWRYLRNEAGAREAVIEVFVRLFQQRGRLRPDPNLAAWLFTALINPCHNRHH